MEIKSLKSFSFDKDSTLIMSVVEHGGPQGLAGSQSVGAASEPCLLWGGAETVTVETYTTGGDRNPPDHLYME